jgi:ribosomal protein L12E/L44/L45/RPP1/RPP2
MYKTAQEIAGDVLLKMAANPGVLRQVWRRLFGHGYEDDMLRARLAKQQAPAAAAAPAAVPEAAATASKADDVAAAATADPEKDKKGMGLLGTGALIAGGGGLGYLLANSKLQVAPEEYPQNYPMPQ